MTKSVNVIVVTFNSRKFLPRLADSVSQWHRVASVTVIDNASIDGSADLARELDWGREANVDVIESKVNHGFGRSVNTGLEALQSEGDYVLVVNPDVSFSANSMDRLSQELTARSDVACAGVQLRRASGEPVSSARHFPDLRSVLSATSRDTEHNNDAVPTDWICGALMLWRRDHLEMLGGFDEKYFLYFEDVDICKRVYENGWSVLYCASIEATHDQGHGGMPSLRLIRANARSRFIYSSVWLGNSGKVASIVAALREFARYGKLSVLRRVRNK